jgi:hypothetical protein
MNIKLNLLTGKAGQSAEGPIFVEEQNFWKYYLNMLSIINEPSRALDLKEIEILSYILAGNPDKSYFRGDEAKEIKELYKLTAPALSVLKSNLVLKGYIEETGVTRGDALPKGNLRKFQKYVKDRGVNQVSFVFAFKFDKNEAA